MGSEEKTVTLVDGSATTQVDWDTEEVREALLGKTPR